MRAILLLAVLTTVLGGCATLNPYLRLRGAIHNHSQAEVQTLLKTHPYEISVTDALIVAAQEGDMAAVNLFLTQGAAINQCNAEGETALTVAARQGNPQMIEYLIQRGADPNGRDGSGNTALDYAKKWIPENVALGDQKEMITQYLTEIANGRKPVMAQIALAIAERRTHIWGSPDASEEKIRVVNLYAPIVIR